ncbi:NADH:flavin oxidoreductase [Novosphingobium album (ex Liu et al. 2023)]|uniref:NADH:flavin oxidoreductase n=1 Tax=Novosphingobium album (ex Liu et al. 2023) TaxID=3031130 RepID=A0ABT5WXE0_9SPHN|nr:NADH:flavin oxidoreductase [Novosphingobium album (ex Liu et al. 2023)]MDE8654524.1 NADH:flavin oxidoreductase [Novosphingobium album (ex Liu et al. 2023)]
MGAASAPPEPNQALLFAAFPFGRTQLRNRLVMAPMTRRHSPGGVPGADVAAYYARRARGGIGLIVTEGTTIDHPAANGYPDVPRLYGADALAGWARVVEAVHAEGAAIIPQLWHVGNVRRCGIEPDPAVPGMGPVDIVEQGETVVRGMTEDDIAAVVDAYARAALDAWSVGFDGIEIHGAHGYLLDSFIWTKTNTRADRYGGPVENRVRFAVETVAAIRRAVGPDFPIVFRFSQWKSGAYDARIADTPEELGAILRPLAQAGVDIFHASTRRFWEPAFAGSGLTLAAWAQRLTGKPAILVGSVGLDRIHETRALRNAENTTVATAGIDRLLEIVADQRIALVALGRALLADAEWANKVAAGRQDAIRGLVPADLEVLT